MDEQIEDPQAQTELPEKVQATETINGKQVPLGALEEFAKKFFSKSLEQALNLKQITLGIEKYVTASDKFYRLTWQGRGKKWLAAENPTRFRSRGRAVAAGIELAAAKGAHFREGTQ
jgi:hypothetical protein